MKDYVHRHRHSRAHHPGTTRARARPLSEAQFQQQITDLCDWLGLRWHHETDSRRSKAGFPDLVIVGKSRVIWVELKSERGRVTKEQEAWLTDLWAAGQRVYVWHPSDLEEATDVLRALAA